MNCVSCNIRVIRAIGVSHTASMMSFDKIRSNSWSVFLFYFLNIISVYHLWFVFFPWGIPRLQSDWSLSCDDGLDYTSSCETTNSRCL